MEGIKKESEPLDNLSSKEIEDIVRSNEILDQENEKLIKEEAIEGGDDIEKELETLRSQLKSGVEALALPPSDLNVNELKTIEIQEVEV